MQFEEFRELGIPETTLVRTIVSNINGPARAFLRTLKGEETDTVEKLWLLLDEFFPDIGKKYSLDDLVNILRVGPRRDQDITEFTCLVYEMAQGIGLKEQAILEFMASKLKMESDKRQICTSWLTFSKEVRRASIRGEIQWKACQGEIKAQKVPSKEEERATSSMAKDHGNITCLKCGQKGHYANKCTKSNKLNDNYFVSGSTPQLPRISCKINGKPAKVLIDTGATCNTCSIKACEKYEESFMKFRSQTSIQAEGRKKRRNRRL